MQGVRLSLKEAFSGGFERVLEAGEVLVRAGEPKTHIYLIESGVVCAYWLNAERTRTVVGFSFEGEIVGLGGLDNHATTVEAGTGTVVRCLPRSALHELMAADEMLADKDAAATRSEMELLKVGLAAQGRAQTLERVASLLSALSSMNRRAGVGGDLIAADINSGYVAGQLGLDVGGLQDALVHLSRLGLVEPAEGGALRLKDRIGLERVAEGCH